jgi:hypothetical protein
MRHAHALHFEFSNREKAIVLWPAEVDHLRPLALHLTGRVAPFDGDTSADEAVVLPVTNAATNSDTTAGTNTRTNSDTNSGTNSDTDTDTGTNSDARTNT